ncbi:MAG: TonB family protein [bacterium]
MKLQCSVGWATVAALLLFAAAVSLVPISSIRADDLLSTGISAGRVKPGLDFDNRVERAARQSKIAEPTTRRAVDTLPQRTVEDARKYQLYLDPTYPRRARLANKEATVEVELTFRPNGTVKNAIVRTCSTPDWGFEQAVLQASLEAKLAGHGNREITVKTTIKFRLQ